MEKDYNAKLVVYGIPEMKKREFNRLIKWLRNTANVFEKEKEDLKIYAKTYTARLMN